MVGGSWNNPDGLYLQFGTTKAVPEVAGEFKSYGESRIVEAQLDLTTVSSTPLIVSNTLFLPSSPSGTQTLYIEQVEVETLKGMTVASGATAINVGVISANDRSTVPTNGATALVKGLINAGFTTPGQKVLLTPSTVYGTYNGSTYCGDWVGIASTNVTYPLNLTCVGVTGAGTYSAGLLKVRIKYSYYGTITQ